MPAQVLRAQHLFSSSVDRDGTMVRHAAPLAEGGGVADFDSQNVPRKPAITARPPAGAMPLRVEVL